MIISLPLHSLLRAARKIGSIVRHYENSGRNEKERSKLNRRMMDRGRSSYDYAPPIIGFFSPICFDVVRVGSSRNLVEDESSIIVRDTWVTSSDNRVNEIDSDLGYGNNFSSR